jgi:DNA-binding SARP family transcriptional activator
LCSQPHLVSSQGPRHPLERRDAALLALLAIEGPTARSRVMALQWPDEAPDQVRGRLRQRIYALKRKLGVEAVEGNHTLALSPGLPWLGFDQEQPDAPLLGDDDRADLPEFAQWLQVTRHWLQTQRRERLAALGKV